jgi:hypothetical protein
MTNKGLFDQAKSTIPTMYINCFDGLNEIQRECWRIYDNKENDPMITPLHKLAALRLAGVRSANVRSARARTAFRRLASLRITFDRSPEISLSSNIAFSRLVLERLTFLKTIDFRFASLRIFIRKIYSIKLDLFMKLFS